MLLRPFKTEHPFWIHCNVPWNLRNMVQLLMDVM